MPNPFDSHDHYPECSCVAPSDLLHCAATPICHRPSQPPFAALYRPAALPRAVFPALRTSHLLATPAPRGKPHQMGLPVPTAEGQDSQRRVGPPRQVQGGQRRGDDQTTGSPPFEVFGYVAGGHELARNGSRQFRSTESDAERRSRRCSGAEAPHRRRVVRIRAPAFPGQQEKNRFREHLQGWRRCFRPRCILGIAV